MDGTVNYGPSFPSPSWRPAPIVVTTDVDAAAWKTAVVAAGGTVSGARLTLVSNFIQALKAIPTPAGNAFLTYDRLWLLAGENQPSDTIDLRTRTQLTPVGGTFTTDRGWAGDNSSAYLNTLYNPTVNAVAYAQDGAHISFYRNVAGAAGAGFYATGAFQSAAGRTDAWIITQNGGNNIEGLLNSPGDTAASPTSGGLGFRMSDRGNSTTIWNIADGAVAGTVTAASAALQNQQLLIGAVNINGSASVAAPAAWDSGRYPMWSCGGSFGSTANDLAVNAAILAYLTAIGAN